MKGFYWSRDHLTPKKLDHNNVNVVATALSVVIAATVLSESLLSLTALSVVTTTTLVCTVMLLPSLSQCYLGHSGRNTVRYTAVTVLCHTSGNCHRCDSVDSSVSDSSVNRNRCQGPRSNFEIGGRGRGIISDSILRGHKTLFLTNSL